MALLLLTFTSTAFAEPALSAKSLQDDFNADVQPLLIKYCYSCHGDGKAKGKLALDDFKTLASIQSNEGKWRHIADNIAQKVMPPEGKKAPTPDEATTITRWIAQTLDFDDPTAPRDPGRVTIHRLNRNEYNNTLRDLLGVTDFKPADDFPADDTGYGFDNIADVLSMSPLLAEKYLAAAEQALDKTILVKNPYERAKKRYVVAALETRGDGNVEGQLVRNGAVVGSHEFPCDGEYEIHIQAAQDKFGDEAAKMVLRMNKKDLASFDVEAPRGDAKVYTTTIKVEKGARRFSANYVNNKVDRQNPDPEKRGDRNLYVDYIEIDGPLNPPPPPLTEGHRRIFFETPGDDTLSQSTCARRIIEHFATRAFRRPVKAEELDALMKLYDLARTQGGENFAGGVKLALTGVLVSPHFLYRIELDPPEFGDQPHPISDYELATRLSYFLWSGPPDDELMDLAKQGTLHEPETLARQSKRMLADERSAAFVRNFVGQWLEIRNLDSHVPDAAKFGEFDDALRQAMRREAEMFFQAIVREDRSVTELLTADYTFVNERLAKLYGIEGVNGEEFRKVSVQGTPRGGVLTMAGVLTVTAMPTRTSPVKRGKFVLEKILASPPPPQPPDVPALNEKKEAIQAASQRERLEKHRENPNCSICHMRMDPIGFSLENFDAIGRWRDKDDGGQPIDASGKLPEGEALDGPAGLRKVLLGRQDQFIRCLIEKSLTYALGRGVERYDRPTIKEIAEKLKKDDGKFSTLVTAIVTSDPFTKRRAAAPLNR